MKSETTSKIRIIGFKNISQIEEKEEKTVRIDQISKFINVVLIDMGGNQHERAKLRQIQEWLRNEPNIQLRKITKKQAFVQTYHQMISSPLKTYFITNLLIEDFANEPLQQMYKQMNEENKGLQSINKQASNNLAKIRFIILKQKMEGINKKNYFHGGIFLITTEVKHIINAIEDHLQLFVNLQPQISTSSVNSEDADFFANKLDNMNEGVKIFTEEQKVQKSQLLGKLYNTPGVGSYNIQNKK